MHWRVRKRIKKDANSSPQGVLNSGHQDAKMLGESPREDEHQLGEEAEAALPRLDALLLQLLVNGTHDVRDLGLQQQGRAAYGRGGGTKSGTGTAGLQTSIFCLLKIKHQLLSKKINKSSNFFSLSLSPALHDESNSS